MAGFVDPHFKTNFTDSKDLGTIKNSKTVEAMTIATKEREDGDARVDLTIATHGTHEPPAKKNKVTLGSILKQTTESRSADTGSRTSLEDKVKKEIESYLQSPKPDADSNPLKLWRRNFASFPTLSVLARKYLCICATSCLSERLISISGNIVTDKRSLLNPEKVNTLTF